MLQLGVPDVKDLEKYFKPSLFSLFKKRGKSNTAIKSRTTRQNQRIARLVSVPVLITDDVQFIAAIPAVSQFQNSKVRFMLIRKLRDVSRAMFIGSILFASPYGAFAQEQKQPTAPPQTGAAPAAKKSKGGADSCDGALDIVPGKAATFTRKRRPSKSETKSEAKSEAKPESKSQ
jgi:hypothetical protein